MVVYEESDAVKEGYAYVPVPVEVEEPEPKEKYAFDLSGVYNAATNFGNAIVKSFQIDPVTNEILVRIMVQGVMCVTTLGMLMLMVIVVV